MSTRARIGIVRPNGSILSIYTHSDGYISHHGPILLEHYDLHSTGYATYSDRMPFTLDTIAFHPTYEGKMLRYLHDRSDEFGWFHDREGDVLVWIVGSAPSRAAMSAALFLEGVGLA